MFLFTCICEKYTGIKLIGKPLCDMNKFYIEYETRVQLSECLGLGALAYLTIFSMCLLC